VDPGSRGLDVRHEDFISRQQSVAQARGILDRDLGITGADGEGGLDQADIGIEAATTSFSSASLATSAEVRMTMSAGAPPRSFSAMAPTAPNSPAMSNPVWALKADERLPTRPCAAPPLRMFTLLIKSVPWRQ
jgi:hypothetical protein